MVRILVLLASRPSIPGSPSLSGIFSSPALLPSMFGAPRDVGPFDLGDVRPFDLGDVGSSVTNPSPFWLILNLKG